MVLLAEEDFRAELEPRARVVVGAVCYGEVILMWHSDWSQVATSREVLSGRKDLQRTGNNT